MDHGLKSDEKSGAADVVERVQTALTYRRDGDRLPLSLKLAYTAFMAVLIPVYWTSYGPTNFLYFCDLALLLTLVGVWRESALLVSMPAAGILAPQVLWIVDYILNFFGIPLTGMTDYMFDEPDDIADRLITVADTNIDGLWSAKDAQ